jgi:hypothetical protein
LASSTSSIARNHEASPSFVASTTAPAISEVGWARALRWKVLGGCRSARGTAVPGAAKPVRPARALQPFLALGLGADLWDVLEKRHGVLELDPIRGHRRSRRVADLRSACAARWLFP